MTASLDDYNGQRINALELSVGILGEKLDHTSDTLMDIKRNLEMQTDLIGKVLLIQERQEVSHQELTSIKVLVTSLEDKVEDLIQDQKFKEGIVKGLGIVLFIVLALSMYIFTDYMNKVDTLSDIVSPITPVLQQAHPVSITNLEHK